MSASFSDGENRVIHLHPKDAVFEAVGTKPGQTLVQAQNTTSFREASAQAVIREVELMITRMRDLESDLHVEREKAIAAKETARSALEKYSSLEKDHIQLKGVFDRNLKHFQLCYDRFNQLKAAYYQEKSQRQQALLELQNARNQAEKSLKLEESLDRIRHQLFEAQRTENHLRSEVSSYLDQIKILSEERRKLELERKSSQVESELQKSMREQILDQDKFLRESLTTTQTKLEEIMKDNQRLSDQNQVLTRKLSEFKTAWDRLRHYAETLRAQANQNQIQAELNQELQSQLEKETNRRRNLEDQLDREKREKELALRVMGEAEAKLLETQRELEKSKARPESPLSESHPPVVPPPFQPKGVPLSPDTVRLEL